MHNQSPEYNTCTMENSFSTLFCENLLVILAHFQLGNDCACSAVPWGGKILSPVLSVINPLIE